MSRLEPLAWPRSRLGEALAALATHSGWRVPVARALTLDDAVPEPQVAAWLDRVAAGLGLELEPLAIDYRRARSGLQGLAPALLRASDGAWLCLLHVRGTRAWLLGPAQDVVCLPALELGGALCAGVEAGLAGDTERMLSKAGVPRGRLPRAREAVLSVRLGARTIADAWLLEPAPSQPLGRHLVRVRARGLIAGMALCHASQYVFWIGAWALLGRAALQGESGPGWITAWGLLLATMLAIQTLGTWLASLFGTATGGLVKARLLYGALRLEPDAVRHQGTGQLLGRVLESEGIESLTLGAGLSGLIGLLELGIAALVLAAGAAGGWHALLLVAWLVLVVLLTRRYHGRRVAWTDRRMAMTHDLVERLVGYRTALIQERREDWHRGEDQGLAEYLRLSERLDSSSAWLTAAVPRGWLLLGLTGLLPALLVPGQPLGGIAAGLGGVLLGQRALSKLTPGLISLAGAFVSWRQVAPIFHAAALPEALGAPLALDLAPAARASEAARPLIEARELHFSHGGQLRPVLSGCTLSLVAGQRLLLEGPSGSGKSTLAALLAGWRVPQAGLLLLRGLDRPTLGANGWRRRVVAVPQFHENHVLTETFAFNLLMGRGWPPDAAALRQAEQVCARLGLDELLRKMPGGLLQMVGDTGWQLSHGERSRLYMARALLQDADLVVLDESFAALDPRTLRQCLDAALDLAPTLVVIAHP